MFPRTLRWSALAMLALASAHPSMATGASVPTMNPALLHPGQKAVVRTVFQGDSIEAFDAEILGILSIGRSEGDIIIARATSERVVRSGVAQGMSGSPVYVDGKLIGALSSGWTFERDPIFGITPIEEMLRVLELPARGDDHASSGPSGVESGPSPRFREFAWPGDGPDELRPGAASGPGPAGAGATLPWGASSLTPLPLPLACVGLHSGALDAARRMLGPFGLAVVPAGQARGGGPVAEALQPGSAVAVDLMTGDLQMSAIGTVTYREGDRVLIFGHPFFQAGDVRMPLSTAEIITIVASDASSFKLGARGREVGVATQDRRPAVGGIVGGHAHLMPFGVTIAAEGRADQRFRFEVLEDRGFAPTLVSIAAVNGLMESGGTGAAQTLRWTMSIARHGARALVLHDVAAGESAFGELMTGIGGPLRYVLNNPYQRVAIDSIAIRIEVEPRRSQWTLRSIRPAASAVRPGAKARVVCEFESWRGGRMERNLDIDVPEEAPDGRYLLWVGGGSELNRFESLRSPAHFRPTSLDDAWRRLAGSRSSDALYGALFARAPEMSMDGRDYAELPASAVILMSGAKSTVERRRSDTATLDEVREAINGVVHGELVIELVVDDHAP